MNKVYVLAPNENWIIDRFVTEWYEDNSDISVLNPSAANVIWLFADFCWRSIISRCNILDKKVITTIHHIVPDKFGKAELDEFKLRDSITTIYHTPCEHTKNFISKLTTKPIIVIPYWANQKIWKKTDSKNNMRKKYGLADNLYLIGSFQRDTEGHDLKSPKLEKGPDLLADAIIEYNSKIKGIEVVLAGWRRQYIISRLNNANIKYRYFELPSQQILNELYQTLDLYPVTARHEGGPQSLIECGLLGIPVVSRDIGLASTLLRKESIADDVTMATPHVPYVNKYKLPYGYDEYRKLILSL